MHIKESRHLVSKLFDVTETSTLKDSLHTEETEIKVPFGRGIAGCVAETKETVNIQEAYEVDGFLYYL
jgi:putative methionine-R-sulfoxide reductase with GAF domain